MPQALFQPACGARTRHTPLIRRVQIVDPVLRLDVLDTLLNRGLRARRLPGRSLPEHEGGYPVPKSHPPRRRRFAKVPAVDLRSTVYGPGPPPRETLLTTR